MVVMVAMAVLMVVMVVLMAVMAVMVTPKDMRLFNLSAQRIGASYVVRALKPHRSTRTLTIALTVSTRTAKSCPASPVRDWGTYSQS